MVPKRHRGFSTGWDLSHEANPKSAKGVFNFPGFDTVEAKAVKLLKKMHRKPHLTPREGGKAINAIRGKNLVRLLTRPP